MTYVKAYFVVVIVIIIFIIIIIITIIFIAFPCQLTSANDY